MSETAENTFPEDATTLKGIQYNCITFLGFLEILYTATHHLPLSLRAQIKTKRSVKTRRSEQFHCHKETV